MSVDAAKHPPPVLTKKQRGRLKKLRKRLKEVREGSETSGLTSLSDWSEWQELQVASQDPPVGPSVRLRRPSRYEEWQKAEGADSRDILWNFAQHLSRPRKRKRDEPSSSIPPWCTLHNPCTVQSVAVVELHLDASPCSWKEIKEQIPVLSLLLKGHKGKVVFPIETRWFQGRMPKSPSDVLMYASRSKHVKEAHASGTKVVEENTSTEEVLQHVVGILQELVLTEKLRKAEGFPMAIRKESFLDNEGLKRETPVTVLIPLDEAKEMLQSYNVQTENGNGDRFVATGHNENPVRVFALDCEMVQTAQGSELARITLILLTEVGQKVEEQVSYKVMLDELVKPYGPILDYVTEYSGVTAASMDPVMTRLEQIQAALISIVHKNDILVGHSLENDMRALRLVHGKVVDTAVVFRAAGGRKYSLRHLSATLLGKKIQSNHGENGHCSEEDASAALSLAVRRAREGPSFRIKERGDDQFHLLEIVQEGPLVCIGPSDWLQEHVTRFQSSAHALTCESVADSNRKAVSAWLRSPKRRAKLVWANLVGSLKGDNKSVPSELNDCLSDIVERMLPGTVLLVCIQRGYAKATEGTKQRKVCMDRRSSLGWTGAQEAALSRLVEQCRSGFAFWIGDSSVVNPSKDVNEARAVPISFFPGDTAQIARSQ